MEQLLVDKYAPQCFESMVGNKKIINKIQNYCMNNLPHLFFVGISGTGKTSLVKVILNKLDADVKMLNGSDSNGVNVFRNKEDGGTGIIDNFAKHSSIHNKPKIIVIDECDGLSKEAMNLLRNKIEKYQKNTRFILTANDDNLIPALKSRFKTFRFNPLDTDDIIKRIKYICEEEGKSIDPQDLQTLAQKSHGDIRRAINNLQTGDYNDEKPKNELETIFAFADD